MVTPTRPKPIIATLKVSRLSIKSSIAESSLWFVAPFSRFCELADRSGLQRARKDAPAPVAHVMYVVA